MRKLSYLLAVVAGVSLFAGCIISDELTTLTIWSDGSARWVKMRSNIHSSEGGAKGAEELAKFVAEFDGRREGDFTRISSAGGEVVEARWVQPDEPFANVITAKFPTAEALENFCSIKDADGRVLVRARFARADSRRRLSLLVPIARDEPPSTKPVPTFQEFRRQQANSLSETRITVAEGTIIASQGFLVAEDKRSCLLDATQIEELLRTNAEQVELFVEWDTAVKR
jgi:hypothetical protein